MLKYENSYEFLNDEKDWKNRINKAVTDGTDFNYIEELISEGRACGYDFPTFTKESIEDLPEELSRKLK